MYDENQAAFAAALQNHAAALEAVEAFTEKIREAVATGDASLIPTDDQANAATSAVQTVRRRLLAELRGVAEKNAPPARNPFAGPWPQDRVNASILEQ